MVKTFKSVTYYSSRANRRYLTKTACAKNEAKFWIREKYPTEEGCAHFGLCEVDCGDDGYLADHDLENYEEIHRRLYKRILKSMSKN